MAHGLDSVNSFEFKSVIIQVSYSWFSYVSKGLGATVKRGITLFVRTVRNDQIVGHIPQVNSKVCAFYIRRGGTNKCRVIGKRQHRLGLEIPCIYIFKGNEKDTNALISLLKS